MTTIPDKQSTYPLPLGMFILLWLVGWTLRVPILAAPPLATRIADDYGLGEAGVGALTMLPVVAVALGAIPAAVIIVRFGLRTALAGGILVMALASAARGYMPSSTLLFVVSVLMGLGVALFQTALPAATRIWTPTHIALGSAVYLNGMMVGELSGAGLTLPLILPLAGGDWRIGLIIWTIPIVLIAFLVILTRTPQIQHNSMQSDESRRLSQKSLPHWNDQHVWQYGLLLAGSIVAFFVINAFVGTLLRARGESQALGGLLFAYNAMPLLASIAALSAPKWIGRRKPIAAMAILAAAGLAGFTFLTGWASWGAALITGFAASIELILLVSLPAAIAKEIAVTRLSAGMTLIGYTIAFVLPLIGGWLAQNMERVEMTLIPSLVFCVAVLFASGKKQNYPTYE